MKYYIIIILIICLSFFGCKRQEAPTPVNGEPVFKFIGSIGADSVNLQAGINHIYMYTGYFKDTQSLMTLRSYFSNDNCTNCEPYLSFEVKDVDVSTTSGLATNIGDLLSGGGTFYSYSLDSIFSTATIEQFKFFPLDNTTGATYNWSFGDGTTSSLATPSHIFTGTSSKDVQLVVSKGGLTDSLTNTINTDPSASNCRVQFTSSIDSFTNQVTVYASPLTFSSYAWNFGNGATGSAPQDTVTYSAPGKYTITLTANGGPACNSTFKQKVNFTAIAQTLANYGYQTFDSTISAYVPRLNKEAFIITWIKNGVIYKSYKNSHGINQSGNPVFTLTSFNFYKENEHGQKTVLISGTVDTYLYNQSNAQDSIKIKSNKIVLAAAYPG